MSMHLPSAPPPKPLTASEKGWLKLCALGAFFPILVILLGLGSRLPAGPGDPGELAWLAALHAGAMQMRHPSEATYPHMLERSILPISANRYQVSASIAGPNAFGWTVEHEILACVYVPTGAHESSECTVESLQVGY